MRTTLRVVAEATGVSVQTASQILNTRSNTRFSQQTREKVMSAASRLGYRPNAQARAMATRKSHQVGLVVPLSVHSWFARLDACEYLLGVHAYLAQQGYVVSVIFLDDVRSGACTSRVFREHVLDGCIILGLDVQDLAPELKSIAPHRIWCDTNIHEKTGCIWRDEVRAGELVADKMIERGCQRLVWVGYDQPGAHYSHSDRLLGVCRVADRHGVELTRVGCREPLIGARQESDIFGQITPRTGIIAEHHHFARLISDAARRKRLTSGFDFSLATCDLSRDRLVEWPNLCGAVVDRSQMGLKAAALLLRDIDTPGTASSSVVMTPEWHDGDTIIGGAGHETS